MVDFYDMFPEFSQTELMDRHERMSLARATLLTTRNLTQYMACDEQGPNFVRDILAASVGMRQQYLKEALLEGGLSDSTADCISRVRRDAFVRPDMQHIAYLNVSVASGNGSWLSVPGLLGPMLEWLSTVRPTRIVEFGSGSGFQLAVMSEYFPDMPLIGYDIDSDMCLFSAHALSFHGYNVTIINSRFQDFIDYRQGDAYIFTFTPTQQYASRFISAMKSFSHLLYPRILSLAEFYNLDDARRLSYSGYDEYTNNPMTVSLSSCTKNYDEVYSSDIINKVKFVQDRIEYGRVIGNDEVISLDLQRIIKLI